MKQNVQAGKFHLWAIPPRKKITCVSCISLVGVVVGSVIILLKNSVILRVKLNFVVLSLLLCVLEQISSTYESKSIDFNV